MIHILRSFIRPSFQEWYPCTVEAKEYWACLSTDLAIEQVLMRSEKTPAGGLTRSHGIGESQRAL